MRSLPSALIALVIAASGAGSPARGIAADLPVPRETGAAAEIPPPLRGIHRIVFLGDSITQAGDYVADFDCWLVSRGIDLEVLNLGLASETAADLHDEENSGHARAHGFGRPFLSQRLDRVLRKARPDLVIACYGMNDGGSLPPGEKGTERYAAAIARLREAALASGAKRVVLCTPPVHDAPGSAEPTAHDRNLGAYASWLVSRRADGWEVVDIHGPMRKSLDEGRARDRSFVLAGDGVHPGREGHWLMARELLEQWLRADLSGIPSAESLFDRDGKAIRDLVRERMDTRFAAWMSDIGHGRPGVPGGPGAPPGPPIDEASRKADEIAERIAARTGGRLPSADPASSVRYAVTWTTPSRDSLDSMPLPGCSGAGANVWVEDGSIWIYLAHNGAYDEQGRLLKLGCLRLTPEDLGLGAAGFRQELDPGTGTISILQGSFSASLWFARETLIIELGADRPRALDVSFATWRDRPKDGLRLDMHALTSMMPDRVEAGPEGILWEHRNADHPVDVAAIAASQGIPREAVLDATTRRVSGGAIAADGGLTLPTESAVRWQCWEGRAWTGKIAARPRQVIAVRLGAAPDGRPREWLASARAALDPGTLRAARAEELARWEEFWSRSHIRIDPSAGDDDAGWKIGRNYQLFRFLLACNRGGELPLLFNGGIFTTDNAPGRIAGNNNDELPITQDGPTSPDFRRWMGCRFMSQNQRWLGWPALASGDADLLEPSLAFYRDRAGTAAARARIHGAEGVVYPEPLDIWGLCCVAPRPDGLCGAEHLTYHFSMMLEHAWMALQARDDLGISLERDLPWILGTVLFYDSFYRAELRKRTGKELGDDGKLVIYPACGLEYAGGATDPIEVIAGLRRITEGLLALPELPEASRARLQEIGSRLPDLPVGRRGGRPSLLPARSLEREYNKWEPIEMYAAWPYRLAGITRPDTLQLIRDTWETVPPDRARLCKQDFSWMANLANMAALAWPEEARKRAIYKLANTEAPQARFPAFFGPGHDWLPDHNWGGSGMTGLQEMLLAPEPGPRGKLHLFPAWPADWDVDFKLHAPGPTIVECVYRRGKVEMLRVTPPSRAKDVVSWLGRWPEYVPPPPPISRGKPVTVSSQFVEPGYDAPRAVDGDPRTRWASDFAARSGWLAVDLGEEREVGRIWISEIEWPETREFVIEVRRGGGWEEIARGTTIGPDRTVEFPAVRAREVRLRVLRAERPININEFQVFPPDPEPSPAPARDLGPK